MTVLEVEGGWVGDLAGVLLGASKGEWDRGEYLRAEPDLRLGPDPHHDCVPLSVEEAPDRPGTVVWL